MSIEFSELFQTRETLRAKIASLQNVTDNVTNRNWAADRILAGTTKAINLRIDDDLRVKDPIEWGQNVLRAGRIKFKLTTVKQTYSKKLTGINTNLAEAQKNTPFGYVTDDEIESQNFDQALKSGLMKGFLSEVPEDFGNLIRQFFTDPNGRRILTIVANFSSNHKEQTSLFNSRLAGAVFEHMSFLHLKPKLKESETELLSPSEVLLLYQNLYLDATSSQITNYGLSEGIMGITIPDGLLISEIEKGLVINSILEYKSWIHQNRRRENYLQPETDQKTLARHLRLEGSDSLDSKYLGHLIHVMRPHLASKAVVVNPEIKTIYAFPQNSKLILPNADTKIIPIDSRDFGEFIIALKYLITAAR